MSKFFQPILCLGTALAVTLLALTPGCKPQPPANVLARVGDRDITVEDFQAEVKFRTSNRQPLPDRQTLLEQMIQRESLVQQARAAGMAASPEMRRAVENLLITRLEESRLTPQLEAVTVAPEEIRAAYEKDAARYAQPAKAQLAFIFIAVDAKANTNQVAAAAERAAEARRLALALPAEARGFGPVAADFSDDQITRYRGGDAGWFTPEIFQERWPKAAVAAGFALAVVGEISDVLRGPNGFYLVKKLDVRAATVTPLAQAQAAIQQRLFTAKRVALERQFKESQRAAVKVTTDPTRLAAVAYPTQQITKTSAPTLPALPAAP